MQMQMQIPPFVNIAFFAALLNVIAFILSIVSLFDDDWYYAHYMSLKIHMGICCTFKSTVFTNVTLVLMYFVVTLSAGGAFMSIMTWIFKMRGAPDGQVARWWKMCGFFNLAVGIFTIFILIYFAVSFHNYPLFRLIKGAFQLSTCYWLLIPILLINATSLILIGRGSFILAR